MQDYTIETIVNGEFPDEYPKKKISLVRGKDFNITPGGGYAPFSKIGLCRADPNNPTGDRTIEWYDENVLKPLIESGKISDGTKSKFDDRKMRYDGGIGYIGNTINPHDNIIVKFGHSHFLEYREKRKRTQEEAEVLTQLGINHFKDPYAFFPRNPGVTGIVLTSDKNIIVGQRNVELDRYEGLLQGAAGHLTYKKNPEDVNLDKDMLMELKEELGITEDLIKNKEFIGLFSDPSVAGDDLDFCYLISTHLPSEYFVKEAWKEKVKKPEHSKFFALTDYNSLQELVNTGNFQGKNYDIIFSTRGALSQIDPKDFK